MKASRKGASGIIYGKVLFETVFITVGFSWRTNFLFIPTRHLLVIKTKSQTSIFLH